MPDCATTRLRLSVASEAVDDLATRLDRFAEIYRSRRGVRVARKDTGFNLSVDPARIETVGPVIEAAADAAGLRIVIDNLAAEINSSGLDGWASGVWAAIGNAVDEDEVVRSRGESPAGDLFRHLRVEEVDGTRVVVDARPPLVDPVDGSPMDAGPQKFDDVGWHDGPAAEAGQPREHLFTHIGIFLAWLIRHDLHDAHWFPRDHIRGVKAGSMTGSDIADDIDWKLISDEMSADGAEFTAARYDRYMSEYNDLLGEDADYRVPETHALYARVAPLIDRLYGEWVSAGRPAPEPKDASPLEAEFDAMFEAADIPWEALARDADGPIAVHLNPDGTYEVERPGEPHEDPDIEALIPADIVDPPISMSSVSATHWGSSLLNRALKQMGIRPRDVIVAAGVGGSGPTTVAVTVYRVPGASQTQLRETFGSEIFRPRQSSWSDRVIGDTTVSWAEGKEGPEYWCMAYWTREELVFHVAGNPSDMEAVIRKVG
jgi:hypothetical protein